MCADVCCGATGQPVGLPVDQPAVGRLGPACRAGEALQVPPWLRGGSWRPPRCRGRPASTS